MKFKCLAVAVTFAVSAPAAWAADSDNSNSVQYIDDANSAQSASSPTSASKEKASGDPIAWKYVNGQKSAAGSASRADQPASKKSSGDNAQSPRAKVSGGDEQTAMSEDPSDQAQGENDEIAAEDSAGEDMMAMAAPGSRSGSFQPATLEDFRAATQDKLVVILPSGWQGSVPQLLAALEQNADAAEVLILSQDANAVANDDDEDEQ